ncbi:MAG: NTP transferase domain-containing protein, partial [Phenylobacterium sp.]|nr:NTP transferase domain-containing protein [Phenylobacterium sp.]
MNLAISRLHVVIPARYNSRRLPGKPLVDLAGKPMVVRVYDKVRAALPDSQIVVAVDDERVLKVLQHHGASTTMTDPAHQSGTDRCAE